MVRLRGHLGAGPPPQPHFMPPSSLFPWAAGRTRPPWVSCRPQNGRDCCLVPGEQGQRPQAPPLHAHLPFAPTGPVRLGGLGWRLLAGARSPGGLGVSTAGRDCARHPSLGRAHPVSLGASLPEGQTGLVGRGENKDPAEQSWRPHRHLCHMGCSAELAWPRVPQTERRASALGYGQARLLRGPSQSFWGRKGPSSRAEHPRDHARTSQGIKGPRPQSRPAPPAAGSFHGRGRWGTEGYRRGAFCFC